MTVTAQAKSRITAKDYRTEYPIDWCPGCGDYGILNALQQALARLGIPPHKTAIFGGIGCSGKTPYHLNAYGIHTLHGRVLPYATGAKLANPELTVVAISGDGDGLAIGAGHFVNSGRRNVNLTYILHNNEVYGLTKGQAAPTLPLGMKTRSQPEPNIQSQVHSLLLAFASGFTWIGRGYAYNVRQLIDLIQQAITHPGLAYLEVLQPCPTYNDLHTREWFAERVYSLQDEGYDPLVPEDADEAYVEAKTCQYLEKAFEWNERIPTGVFLQNLSVPSFEARIANRTPIYKTLPPARRIIADETGHTATDLSEIFDELAMT
ncbi:MAG: 2-oxoacid:ferredoxin oxidoreductase subunit beta [Anaerolineae bacterium]|nr:2-oxoacid:ferredoxin oxidoreductase subunit beta [Anaerolineae bacterium]